MCVYVSSDPVNKCRVLSTSGSPFVVITDRSGEDVTFVAVYIRCVEFVCDLPSFLRGSRVCAQCLVVFSLLCVWRAHKQDGEAGRKL